MSETIPPIRRSVTVRAPVERAFEVFTRDIGTWWPLHTHSRAESDFEGEGVKAERVDFPDRVGEQIVEHLSNGQALPWGSLVAYDPPSRLVIAWKPNSTPKPPTEVVVTFTPDGEGTRVDLEHRGWERLDAEALEARSGYDEGWARTLGLFATAAEARVA